MLKNFIILSMLAMLCVYTSSAESGNLEKIDYIKLSEQERANLERQLWDPKNYSSEIEISGKILNKDGSPYFGEAKICIKAETLENWDFNQGGPPVAQNKEEAFETKSQNGIFSWKGHASRIIIGAEVDNFHSTVDRAVCTEPPATAKRDDLVIYLIPKGIPSKLEYTEGAEINAKGNKPHGWSFTKRWYYSADEEGSVWMTLSFDEGGKPIYTMKEPGGFVYFAGCQEPYTVYSKRYWASFDFMTEAPETGYTPVFALKDYRIPQTEEEVYCYFKTPTGKYGKMKFNYDTRFDYYLQPDGSRNLEVEKRWFRHPKRPDAEYMPDDQEAYPLDY